MNDFEFNPEQEKKVREWIELVPFGHSLFQIQKFVFSHAEIERNIRQGLLELHKKYIVLKEAQFRRKRYIVEKKQKQKEASKQRDALKRELINIDMEEKDFKILTEEKLIRDALLEFCAYYAILEPHMKDFTREGFEKKEPVYWQHRLLQQAENMILSSGTVQESVIEAMHQSGLDVHSVMAEMRLRVAAGQKVLSQRVIENDQKQVQGQQEGGTMKA
jgi:hypothetical protein